MPEKSLNVDRLATFSLKDLPGKSLALFEDGVQQWTKSDIDPCCNGNPSTPLPQS